MNEKVLEHAIIDRIRYEGGWAQKIQSGTMYKNYKRNDGKEHLYRIKMADQGTPDIIACINGLFVAIEVKRDEKEVEKWQRYPLSKTGKMLTYDPKIESQQHQRNMINKSGGFHFTIGSLEQYESAMKFIKTLKKTP